LTRPSWFFEDFEVGTAITTSTRTVTEADLAAFVGLAGFFEPLFIDARVAERSHFGRRIVPGQLTFVISEGLLVLSGAMHHGLALLGVDGLAFSAPVGIGDTLHVEVGVTGARRTSAGDRGVVGFAHRVLNGADTAVLTYTSTRMIAARPVEVATA
jgi:acyl dehydratase